MHAAQAFPRVLACMLTLIRCAACSPRVGCRRRYRSAHRVSRNQPRRRRLGRDHRGRQQGGCAVCHGNANYAARGSDLPGTYNYPLRRCTARSRTIAAWLKLPPTSGILRLSSRSGLRAEINANGSLRRFDCESICLPLFVGNELDGGPANLYLRRHADTVEWTPLLGPTSRTTFHTDPASGMLVGIGSWPGINYSIALVLAQSSPAWFWHVRLENTQSSPTTLDLTYAQDLALAPYGAIRLNEFYVSQYIDHTPLQLPGHGVMIASRQNQAADGKHPWCLIGSLRQGASFGTDALQFHGLATRAGLAPVGMSGELPGRRLQHEHSMVVIRDSRLQLAARGSCAAGFFGAFLADHAGATSADDIQHAHRALALPEADSPGNLFNR